LNIVRTQDKLPPIDVDGVVGPETLGAILEFQRLHTQAKDDRIDPHGPSLRELERLVAPVIGARIKSAATRILDGLSYELESRGLRLTPELQNNVDSIERAVLGLQSGAPITDIRPAVYYPQRRGRRFQPVVAVVAAPAAAAAAAAEAAEAALLILLAVIALLIFIHEAPAMGRSVEDLLKKIQAVMAKLIDDVEEAIQEVEDLIKRNSKAGMLCSAALILFRKLSQQLLDLLKAPRSPDELGRRRFEKQLTELFQKWQQALEDLFACLAAKGATF
jgi:hypothetical protein